MSKKTKKSPLNIKDYERLGRTLESIFEGGYVNHRRVYGINFLRGLLFGLGAALGGTIIIAIIIWVLSLFGELPVIGEFFQTIRDSLDQ